VVVGAGLNVAVAWAAATWGSLRPGSMSPVPRGHTMEVPPPELLWQTPVAAGWPRPDSVLAARSPGLAVQVASNPDRTVEVTRAGWPLLCLRSTYVLVGPSRAEAVIGWRRIGPELGGEPHALQASSTAVVRGLPITATRSVNLTRRLPVAPMLPEMLANTLVYGAMAAVSFVAVRSVRRSLRRRRGCCVACGYSRAGLSGGAVCPECGAGSGPAGRGM